MTPAAGRPSDWRPLVQISSTSWLGGVEGDEGTLWTADAGGARRRPIDLANPMGCLPLLERPYDEVLAELNRGADTWAPATRGAMSRLIAEGVVIEAAFRIGNDYWFRGALTWLEALEPSEQTAAWAARLENAAGTSQATRHAARRLRRSWTPG